MGMTKMKKGDQQGKIRKSNKKMRNLNPIVRKDPKMTCVIQHLLTRLEMLRQEESTEVAQILQIGLLTMVVLQAQLLPEDELEEILQLGVKKAAKKRSNLMAHRELINQNMIRT